MPPYSPSRSTVAPRFIRGLLLIPVLAVAGACVGDDPTKTGGAADSGVAAPIATGSGTLDASVGRDDAGVNGDAAASGDAGDAGDAGGPTTWCTGRSEKFCWDFDRGTYDSGWTHSEALGTVTQSSDATSLPRAMQALILPGADSRAQLFRGFGPLTTFTRVGVSVKLLDARVDALRVASLTISSSHTIFLQFGDAGAFLINGSSSHRIGSVPPPNSWVRYEWRADWHATAGRIQAWIDGVSVLDESNQNTLGSDAVTLHTLNVGLRSAATQQTRAVLDNVTVDY